MAFLGRRPRGEARKNEQDEPVMQNVAFPDNQDEVDNLDEVAMPNRDDVVAILSGKSSPISGVDMARLAGMYPDIVMGNFSEIPNWAVGHIRNSGHSGRYLFVKELVGHNESDGVYHVMPVASGDHALVTRVKHWKPAGGTGKLIHDPLVDETEFALAQKMFAKVAEFVKTPALTRRAGARQMRT